MNSTQVFVNGQWARPANGKTLDMIAPSTGEKIGSIARGTAADIDMVVCSAGSARKFSNTKMN